VNANEGWNLKSILGPFLRRFEMSAEKISSENEQAKSGKWVTNWIDRENRKRKNYRGKPREKESDRLAALARKREQEAERNQRQREAIEAAKAMRAFRAKEAADKAPNLRDMPREYVAYWKERLATCAPYEKRTAYMRLHEAEAVLQKRLEAL